MLELASELQFPIKFKHVVAKIYANNLEWVEERVESERLEKMSELERE